MSDSMHEGPTGAEPGPEPATHGQGQQAQHPPAVGGRPGEWARRSVGDFDPRYKSPRSATFLSLVVPGLGQVYTGFYKRGMMIAVALLFLFIIAMESSADGPMIPFAIIFAWMFAVIDAGRMAALYNYAVAGGEDIEMPQDIKVPHLGGSIVAGGILIVFGGIALSNTLYDIPLRWLENWWPVFPLALGGYLLIRGVMDHVNVDKPADDFSESVSAEQE